MIEHYLNGALGEFGAKYAEQYKSAFDGHPIFFYLSDKDPGPGTIAIWTIKPKP